jgi:NADH-quinone oxidoreductase subunit N
LGPAFGLNDLLPLAPEILLAGAGLLLLLAGAIGRGLGNRESALIALASLGLAGGLLLRVRAVVPDRYPLFNATFMIDGFSFFVKLIVLIATALVILLSIRFLEEGRYRAAEYHALLLLAPACSSWPAATRC